MQSDNRYIWSKSTKREARALVINMRLSPTLFAFISRTCLHQAIYVASSRSSKKRMSKEGALQQQYQPKNSNNNDNVTNQKSPSKRVGNVSTLSLYQLQKFHTVSNTCFANPKNQDTNHTYHMHNINNSTSYQMHFRSTKEHLNGQDCQPQHQSSYPSHIECMSSLLSKPSNTNLLTAFPLLTEI